MSEAGLKISGEQGTRKEAITMKSVFHGTQVNGKYVTLTSLVTLAFVLALCSTAEILWTGAFRCPIPGTACERCVGSFASVRILPDSLRSTLRR
jgi:hypothetical protein